VSQQSFDNHARIDLGYHRILFPILLLTFIGSCVNLNHSIGDHQRLYSASLITVISMALVAIALYARIFALKAQDRAIRAEESLRHYVLTGKLLDPRLNTKQIVALRFAPDNEFVDLAAKAAQSAMDPKAIKQAIRQWKPDDYRV
jgi:L-cystine uptake protein TcyP (sodium:dicarboxylate symporter family)